MSHISLLFFVSTLALRKCERRNAAPCFPYQESVYLSFASRGTGKLPLFAKDCFGERLVLPRYSGTRRLEIRIDLGKCRCMTTSDKGVKNVFIFFPHESTHLVVTFGFFLQMRKFWGTDTPMSFSSSSVLLLSSSRARSLAFCFSKRDFEGFSCFEVSAVGEDAREAWLKVQLATRDLPPGLASILPPPSH